MTGIQRRTGIVLGTLWACVLYAFTGCQPNGWYSTPPSSSSAVITVQPLSQVVPPGETATFTVVATSDKPLTYQWFEGDNAISGATSSSYTTPPVSLGANGSNVIGTFTVRINDGSVVPTGSQPAILEVGPRAPKPGDLRYLLDQQVPAGDLGKDTGCAPFGDCTLYNALGSPDSINTWQGSGQFLVNPSGYSMHYQPGTYSSLVSDMQSISPPNAVVTSLGLTPASPAGNSLYYVSWVQDTQAGVFDYRFDPIIPSGTGQQAQIQAQATLDGTQSRVITAVFFDFSGGANLISYGWQGDTTTVYEAKTTLVPPGSNIASAVAAAATDLANNGYFISAFGGDDTNGYVLVGMRVQGDSYPRPIQIGTWTGPAYSTTTAVNPTSANFSIVGWLFEQGNSLQPGESVIISEQ